VSKAEKENKSGSKKRTLDKINKSNSLCPYRMRLTDFHSTKRQVEVAAIFLYKVMVRHKYTAELPTDCDVNNYEV